MNYVELSIKSLSEKSSELGRMISDEYAPDVIVFIARGGYIVARQIQAVLGSKLIGANAARSGNKLKEHIVPILKLLPEKAKIFLRSVELNSGIHEKKTERKVELHNQINYVNQNIHQKFLIVDDSIDTGYSMKAVYEEIKKLFHDSEIRCAALNVWDKSKNIINADYVLYRNTIIKTPMSKDSKEYGEFLRIYDEYLNSEK